MKLKRLFSVILTVCLLSASLIACGGKSSTSASKDFDFTYKGETITIHSEAKEILKVAGTPKATKKTASCAYDGYDRTYEYNDFTILTYSKSKDGEEYINGINLTTPNIATKEDIKIGSSQKQVLKAYGNEKGKFGVYTFTKGKSKLVIEIDDKDKVSSIKYMEK